MRLKIATTSCLISGIILLVIWPWILGPRPTEHAGRQAMARYGLRMLTYFGVTAAVFLATAILAWFVLRQTREQFFNESAENLKGLINATLEDHEQKRD